MGTYAGGGGIGGSGVGRGSGGATSDGKRVGTKPQGDGVEGSGEDTSAPESRSSRIWVPGGSPSYADMCIIGGLSTNSTGVDWCLNDFRPLSDPSLLEKYVCLQRAFP